MNSCKIQSIQMYTLVVTYPHMACPLNALSGIEGAICVGKIFLQWA